MAAALERGEFGGNERARERLRALGRYALLAAAIERFWLLDEHRRQRTWAEHREINEVMLATSLAPQGFLLLSPPLAPGER
jgi:hypothetical protein